VYRYEGKRVLLPKLDLLLSLLQCLCFLFTISVGYVAGFVDAEVRDRSDLFDVYVNLPDSEITVSQNAKGERFCFTD